MVSQEPAPRGTVKVREATAERLDLDGEHGDGMCVALTWIIIAKVNWGFSKLSP
jgi:hypothetical protein